MNGHNGLPGRDGRDGAKGEKGLSGPSAPRGIKGEAGVKGVVGPRGPRGMKGEAGPVGRVVAEQRNWKQCAWKKEDSKDIGLIKVSAWEKNYIFLEWMLLRLIIGSYLEAFLKCSNPISFLSLVILIL